MTEDYDPEDERDYPDDDEDLYFSPLQFADPGGKSALRAATPDNPRNLPCPRCHTPNVLTPADQALGYVCDRCADEAERGVP